MVVVPLQFAGTPVFQPVTTNVRAKAIMFGLLRGPCELPAVILDELVSQGSRAR